MASEKFIIQGGKRLKGTVEIGGYKNAAGAILAATLLTDKWCLIEKLPLVEDVFSLLKILEQIGVEISWQNEKTIKLRAGPNLDIEKIDFNLVSKSRVSVLLIGSLLSRFQNLKISHPGGDKIGVRPILTHLEALKKLGVDILQEGEFYYFQRKQLIGTEIVLKEFSVTATENLMMLAVLSQGKTVIKGAAAEPQVQDLGKMLKNMGAKIEGVGTNTILIEGVKELVGVSHQIIPDPLETGTFVIIGATNSGRIEIENCVPSHLDIFLAKLEEIGVDLKKGINSIQVNFSPKIRSTKIQALPYPGFPTDLLPVALPLLTQADGKSLVHDPLYENRLNFTQELRKMGADIEVVDPHRAFIFGKTPLFGVRIESWDIRAGASLVVAGLLAKDRTVIENIYQIDRGYEKIEEKLQKLGADIKRVTI
ncbi:MAG: UDP-N-acetylglucosamine 1-carboxyvinyltransferase [Candidatus Nealsonbacteria bacterium RBG_13_36_15]|uniref:UDP-N-acetylglucosamine 1-carboxyvinyltransferase n=1 Tax=Candidatus Nealsonbacteria bacterium RBG_13_36_15 TaxID=1801660 RepID=A0A1G2DUM5_9BACT|nr:MAG: UDP-N-acetylglucosamine 1-carboxyvinyltransferase [Candidatus Nealsonbacteria bacterium RBG_13_36_15]